MLKKNPHTDTLTGRECSPSVTGATQQLIAYRGRDRDYVGMHTMSAQLACVAYLLTHFPCFVCLWLSASMMFAGCKCLAEWFINMCVCVCTICCPKRLAVWLSSVFVCVVYFVCGRLALWVTQPQLLLDWLCHCHLEREVSLDGDGVLCTALARLQLAGGFVAGLHMSWVWPQLVHQHTASQQRCDLYMFSASVWLESVIFP